MNQTSPDAITARAVSSFAGSADPRLREIMESLTKHLHAFVRDVRLTDAEWRIAIDVLTRTGHITTEQRQEFILWSDELGITMLVDAIGHGVPANATESTILGPFYAPGAQRRGYGESMIQRPAGTPCWYEGTVRSLDGTPLADAELDVWQNGHDRLYAVQDDSAPEHHLRGVFSTRDNGEFGFIGVRPEPYTIPHDGPAGEMLAATGRHPWRPAHIHLILRAPGHQTLTTHIFDDASEWLDSDAVFATKPSLFRTFVERDPDDPDRPEGIDGRWYSLRSDFVLVPGEPVEPIEPGRTA